MKHFLATVAVTLITLLPIVGQTESIDLSVANKLKLMEMKHSLIDTLVYQMVDLAGPRLAGSDGMERGHRIAEKLMKEFNLSHVRTEYATSWERGGWDLEKAYAAMNAPYYYPIYPAPVGWTGSTKGLVKSEVVLIEANNKEDLLRYKGKLKGKIVLMPSTSEYQINFKPLGSRHTEESLRATVDYPMPLPAPPRRSNRPDMSPSELLLFIRSEEPAVIVNESGDFNVPGIHFSKYRDGEKEPPCEINITLEAHGLMERLIRSGEKVTMEVDVKTRFTPKRDIMNVIGEIEGTDLKEEIVLIGAHLDSYHITAGAGDDAAGCIVMLEAMRLLKESGVKPRRTIRIALWGGEEMGLLGSSGYINRYVYDRAQQQPKEEFEKISAYFNSDYGPGKFRGIYTQDNLEANPIFTAWAKPFNDMGFTTVSNKSVGSTDHISFDRIGIPGFQFITDELEWGRGSHRVMDTSDRLHRADLRHNAVVAAWFAYCAAMRDNPIPRKPIFGN